MDTFDYKKLLQEEAWKAKRMEILQRDNFVCQNCHTRGIHNDTYFSINSLGDIEAILPSAQSNGMKLSDFCDNCEWSEQIRSSYKLKCKNVGYGVYFCTMSNEFDDSELGFKYSFLSDREISEIHFKKSGNCFIQMKYKGKEILGKMHIAFAFEEDISKMNYAAVSYKKENGSMILKMRIYFKRKLYYLSFYPCKSIDMKTLFDFKLLQIHHKCYIKGKKPWEYDNDNLITLCEDCHQKISIEQKC